MDGEAWEALVSAADPGRSLDAALLLRRTGTPLAAWTRGSVPLDVVSVMSATLVSSVETIAETVHSETPRSIRVETEKSQMLATRIDPKMILVLVAPRTVGEAQVGEQARRIASMLAGRVRDEQRLVPSAPPIRT